MRPLEFNGVIGRTQDYSQIKQNEDAKPIVMQQQITESITKQVETKSEQVYQKKEKDMEAEYDASREGNGTYEENERKQRKKKEEDGKVVIKGRANFDVKI